MLDFIRDIYTSFRQTSLERVKSPFLGAFVFSWVGFNWQMLAIIFFSKKGIEERLELINKSFDIGNYLLAPICTTAMIVIILPQINKIITKIQDKPNTETIELSLESKIRIAELQQSLAESEARKKLADKKEERYIEEGIHAIKKGYERAKNNITEQESEITKLLHFNNELQGQLAKAESKFNVEQESKNQIQKELVLEKDNNRKLGEQIIKLNSDVNNIKSQLNSAKEAHDATVIASNRLLGRIQKTERVILKYANRYPSLVNVNISSNGFIVTPNSVGRKLLRRYSRAIEIAKNRKIA